MIDLYIKRNTRLKWVKTLNEICVEELLHPLQTEYVGSDRRIQNGSGRSYPFIFFKGCLLQILPGLVLKTLVHRICCDLYKIITIWRSSSGNPMFDIVLLSNVDFKKYFRFFCECCEFERNMKQAYKQLLEEEYVESNKTIVSCLLKDIFNLLYLPE